MTVATEQPVATEELYEFIGHHIRTHRLRMRLSQEDLGFLVGRRSQTVSRWETGESSPSLGDLLKVAQLVGQPIGAFLPRGAA